MPQVEIATCDPFKHDWREEYYGYRCLKCNCFIPYGSEPWLPYDENGEDVDYDNARP